MRKEGGAMAEYSCAECRERLLEYVSGGLSPDERHRIERHLATCAACRREADLWRAVGDAFAEGERRVPTDTSAAAGWAAVRSRLAAPTPTTSTPARRNLMRPDTRTDTQSDTSAQAGPAPARLIERPAPRWRPYAAVAAVLLLGLLSAVLFGVFGQRGRAPGGPGATPSAPPVHQDLSALSPDLARYVAAQGDDMGVAVYDVTRNRYYAYHEDAPFVLGSSAKVYILAAYLDYVESQGRRPDAGEVRALTAMIEQSDNDAAQLLYDHLGNDAGQRAYLEKIGITGYAACTYGWGCAELSPGAMVKTLALLQTGRILSAEDRAFALDLLKNVQADQRFGVGETAPSGAQVYMKAGWVPYPDTAWNLNSSGIVVTGGETYVISVYSKNQPSMDWAKVDHVCAAVAQALA